MIKHIGIVGSGKMGAGIFNYLSEFEYHITWYILFDDEKDKLKKSFQKKIGRQLKNEIINKIDFNRKSQYIFTTEIQDLASCDLIIESITEDKSEKQNLFKTLEGIVNSECLFVSNSSSIFSSDLQNKITVFGMHFFYPVAFKDTVELIISDNSDGEVSSELKDFLQTIKKKTFVQTRENPFLLNRFLLNIQAKALELKNKYVISYNQLDMVSKELIPDFGLFEMMDHVGHKTMYNSIRNYSLLEKKPQKYSDLLFALKQKIETNSDFNSDDDSTELSDTILSEIRENLVSEINTTLKYFSSEFSINEQKLYNYVNDFCGLSI